MVTVSERWSRRGGKKVPANLSSISYDPESLDRTLQLHLTRMVGGRKYRIDVELSASELQFIDRARMGAVGTAKDEGERCLRASQVAERMRPLAASGHEEFWAVLLDARLRVVKAVLVAQGGITQCSVAAREAFRAAIISQAPAVAFVHNHPSGDPTPSVDDQRLQVLLDEGGHTLGVRVVDHVVVASSGFHSAVEGRGTWEAK